MDRLNKILLVLFVFPLLLLAWPLGLLLVASYVIYRVYRPKTNVDLPRQEYGFEPDVPPRVTFNHLVLDSKSGNTPHTEIDQVIVSPYGIFCIEYKAHKGIIFGSEKGARWTQCLYSGEKRQWHNPLRQNYKHVCALRDLLKDELRAPIHSYVVYTDAYKVNVDSKFVFSSVDAMQYTISNHRTRVYSIEQYNSIARKLAIESTKSPGLMDQHIREVQAYLAGTAS